MDDLIYEEFKGTGNMELHLSRRLSDRRVFPAFEVDRSSTRRDDLLLEPELLQRVTTLRRMVEAIGGSDALEAVLTRMAKTRNNKEFLDTLAKDNGR